MKQIWSFYAVDWPFYVVNWSFYKVKILFSADDGEIVSVGGKRMLSLIMNTIDMQVVHTFDNRRVRPCHNMGL